MMSKLFFLFLILFFASIFAYIAIKVLHNPERRYAQKKRSQATHRLFSTDGDLDQILQIVQAPLEKKGSLKNLLHYLSKDLGRRKFPRIADRRKEEAYLSSKKIPASFPEEKKDKNSPPWAASFTFNVRFLFDRVMAEITPFLGIPYQINDLGENNTTSLEEHNKTALARFGKEWIPAGELLRSYSPSRQKIRSYLVANRRFSQSMEAQDNAWLQLIAELYNLSVHPNWQIVLRYDPQLSGDLDNLIVSLLTADIHRRTQDLLGTVQDNKAQTYADSSAGIFWTPNLRYYKNISELTGEISDKLPINFFIKVNLGYSMGDRQTQTWLNQHKEVLHDYLKTFFSRQTSALLMPRNNVDETLAPWINAQLKAKLLHGINTQIVKELPFATRQTYGVRELAFIRINLLPQL